MELILEVSMTLYDGKPRIAYRLLLLAQTVANFNLKLSGAAWPLAWVVPAAAPLTATEVESGIGAAGGGGGGGGGGVAARAALRARRGSMSSVS